MVGLGLQLKTMDETIKFVDLPIESALGQFNRAIRRFLKAMCTIQEMSLARHLPKATAALVEFTPVAISLDEELDDAAKVCSVLVQLETLPHGYGQPNVMSARAVCETIECGTSGSQLISVRVTGVYLSRFVESQARRHVCS